MPDDTQTITLMQTPHVNKNVGSLPTFQMRPTGLRTCRKVNQRENSRSYSTGIIKKLRVFKPEKFTVLVKMLLTRQKSPKSTLNVSVLAKNCPSSKLALFSHCLTE